MIENNFINIHIHKKENAGSILDIRCISPEENFSNDELISVGIHPWDADLETHKSKIDKMDELLKTRNVVAVGETGIDRLKNNNLDLQIELFEIQLQIAQKYDKPVIIHCVRGFNELLTLRKKYSATPWIVHDYRKNVFIAEQLIEHNCYLSFGRVIENPLTKLKTLLETIDLNKIFFETDDFPINIKDIYIKFAELRKIQVEELIKIINNNYKTIFGNKNELV